MFNEFTQNCLHRTSSASTVNCHQNVVTLLSPSVMRWRDVQRPFFYSNHFGRAANWRLVLLALVETGGGKVLDGTTP